MTTSLEETSLEEKLSNEQRLILDTIYDSVFKKKTSEMLLIISEHPEYADAIRDYIENAKRDNYPTERLNFLKAIRDNYLI